MGYTSKGVPFISLTTASTAIGAYLCFYARKITGAERHPRPNQRDGVYNITYSGKAAHALSGHLYYSGCLSLKRKQSAADSVANWVRPTGWKPGPERIQWTSEKDKILLSAPTIDDACAELGHSQNACRARLTKLLDGMVPLPK
ncbi:hypothetical protein [Streptomyces flaveus]|uniref:Uncharacterized protein n=1 Tax=Streptomyces flaveus TaxID=66370 RepID=A0A917VMI7_9ACTN|nr:hypothetical protein [Streptomyces flaveus]GGL00216.1 hypothetical protein GCM10010094_71120 [Streptomyces flaveus]